MTRKIIRTMIRLSSLYFGFLILQTSALGWIEVCKESAEQWQSSVAFYDNQFLVAWTDLRDLPTDSSTNIYACRIATNGAVLDTWGILVASNRRDEMVPRICAGTLDWLVIWQEGC